MEQLNLTTPITTPNLTNYRVQRLDLDWGNAVIHIDVVSNTEKHFGHEYRGAIATTLMRALNTANLTAESLHRRVLKRLISDGVLPGAVSGTPD